MIAYKLNNYPTQIILDIMWSIEKIIAQFDIESHHWSILKLSLLRYLNIWYYRSQPYTCK